MPEFSPPYRGPDPEALFSPYAALIGTNYAAQGKDSRAVRDIMVAAEEELSRLHAHSSWIKARRKVFERFYEGYNALLSPMRRVPDEVLRELMVHCVANYWIGGHHSPSWALSQVCNRWRSVARSTPSLWSYISIHFDLCRNDDALPLGALTPIVQKMLALSKNSPLSLELSQKGEAMDGWDVWRILFAHSDRIAFLRVVVRDSPHSGISARDFPQPFPILRTLELYNTESVAQIFKDSLQLKSVRLSNVANTLDSYTQLALPWAQLTSAAIQHDTGDLDQFLATLKNMTCLEELILSIGKAVVMPSGDSWLDDPVEVAQLPKLKRLFFRTRNSEYAKDLVRSLFLPALEEVALDIQFDGLTYMLSFEELYGRFYDRFTSLVESSGCLIRKFSLIDIGEMSLLDELLESMPELESFRYFASFPSRPWEDHKDKMDTLLKSFIREVPLKGSLPFPRLKTLEISGAPLDEKGNTVIQLLRERYNTLHSLRLHVSNSTFNIDPSDLTEYIRLGSGKTKVSILSDKSGVFKNLRMKRERCYEYTTDTFQWTGLSGGW